MNIGNIHDCFGCGVCALACGRKIINIVLNKDGFYEPEITDIDNCTDCGLCVDVCSYSHNDLSLKDVSISSFAGWSKDTTVREKCSSGGVAFELGKQMLSSGFKVCAVRYDVEKNQAEHYIATTEEELIPSIGSKYIQSYTVDGFRQINRKEKYLVVGTPCQIDSFRRYIQKYHCENNFILLDFFCHGVPSKLMWDKYVHWAEAQVGKINKVSWRNKSTGWHDSYAMSIEGEQYENDKKQLISSLSQGDMFFKLFLSDSCLNKACYEKCRFKWNQSSADIRIGDAWTSLFNDNEYGVNVVISFTERGRNIFLLSNCCVRHYSFDDVAENQMNSLPLKTRLYTLVMHSLRNKSDSLINASELIDRYRKRKRWKNRIIHPMNSMRKIIKMFNSR